MAAQSWGAFICALVCAAYLGIGTCLWSFYSAYCVFTAITYTFSAGRTFNAFLLLRLRLVHTYRWFLGSPRPSA